MNAVNINPYRRQLPMRLGTFSLVCALSFAPNLSVAQESAHAPSPAGLTSDGLAARYPTGSIQSGDDANRALAEVERQRAGLEQQYTAEQHDCYSRFFATSCLDAAKERRRSGLAVVRKVEIEANAYIRGARVVERDKHLADKSAENAKNPPKPLLEPQAKIAAPGADHAADASVPGIAAPGEKPLRARQDYADDTQKRAEAVQAYEKKARDAAARQRDVAEKKKEKESKAAAKAAAASASSATKP